MNRRHFLQVSTAALASTALTPADALAAAPRTIGLQLYTLRDAIAKDGLDATLAAVAKIGYKEVEMFGYHDGKWFGKTAKEVGTALKANGLKMPSGHYVTGRTPDFAFEGSLTKGWERAVADAAEAGQQYAVLAYLFPAERRPEDYAALPDLMTQAAETARKAGLQFCYHNHDFEFTEKVNGVMPYDILLSRTDPKLVQMELDLYWITKAKQDPIAYFQKHPGRFPLWHVKDMEKTVEGAFAEVGTGSIDFKRIFAQRKLAGNRHYFVEQDVCKRPPLDSITTSYQYLRKMPMPG